MLGGVKSAREASGRRTRRPATASSSTSSRNRARVRCSDWRTWPRTKRRSVSQANGPAAREPVAELERHPGRPRPRPRSGWSARRSTRDRRRRSGAACRGSWASTRSRTVPRPAGVERQTSVPPGLRIAAPPTRPRGSRRPRRASRWARSSGPRPRPATPRPAPTRLSFAIAPAYADARTHPLAVRGRQARKRLGALAALAGLAALAAPAVAAAPVEVDAFTTGPRSELRKTVPITSSAGRRPPGGALDGSRQALGAAPRRPARTALGGPADASTATGRRRAAPGGPTASTRGSG